MPPAKHAETNLTPLELEIMNVLWETGPASVQTVQSRFRTRDLAYTTMQTMLNVLHRKGKVSRKLKDRAYIYSPVLSRKTAVSQALGDMLNRFFGGSADSLVLSLVETRHLTPEKLGQLQKLLESTGQKTDTGTPIVKKEKKNGNA